MDVPNELRRGIGWGTADHPPPQHKAPTAIDQKVPDLGDLADRIDAACHAAELALADGFTRAIAAGELLVEAKLKTGHGQWLPWLKANTRVPPRTAQLYMRLAQSRREIEAKAQDFAYLTIDQAVKLIAAPKDDAKAAKKTEKPSKPEPVAADSAVEPPLFPADPPQVPVVHPPVVVIDMEAVEVTPPEPEAAADPMPEPELAAPVSVVEVAQEPTDAAPADPFAPFSDDDLLAETRRRMAARGLAVRIVPNNARDADGDEAEDQTDAPSTVKAPEADERRERVVAHLGVTGMTKTAFANAIGVPSASLRNWTNGIQPLAEKYHAAVDAALSGEG